MAQGRRPIPETSKALLHEVANRIKQVRKVNDMTQEQFANQLGIQSRSSYSQVESGNCMPTVELVITVAQVFNISYDWLLDGTGEPDKPRNDD